jgi:hypothetical protein
MEMNENKQQPLSRFTLELNLKNRLRLHPAHALSTVGHLRTGVAASALAATAGKRRKRPVRR